MNAEDRLRIDLERISAVLPALGVDLDATLHRGRRLRARRMVATAAVAAALVAVAIGASSLISNFNRDPEPLPVITSPPETSPTPGGTPTPDELPTQDVRLDDIEPVLREWLNAIRNSEEDAVWDLMTPEAQEIVGRDTFGQIMQSALPEGLGGFADASEVTHVVVSQGAGEARVVAVASGEITREATTEFDAIAIPMRVRDGETLVDDPFIGRDRYFERAAVFASVSAGPFSFHQGDELTVEFSEPAGITGVSISVDDDTRPLDTEFDAATGTASATLDRDLGAGQHIATVVVVHSSGRHYPEAIIFEAGS